MEPNGKLQIADLDQKTARYVVLGGGRLCYPDPRAAQDAGYLVFRGPAVTCGVVESGEPGGPRPSFLASRAMNTRRPRPRNRLRCRAKPTPPSAEVGTMTAGNPRIPRVRVVVLPDRTIRSHIRMAQAKSLGVVDIAFASGDVITLMAHRCRLHRPSGFTSPTGFMIRNSAHH